MSRVKEALAAVWIVASVAAFGAFVMIIARKISPWLAAAFLTLYFGLAIMSANRRARQ